MELHLTNLFKLFRVCGGDYMRGLAKIGCKGERTLTLKNWIVCLFFHFMNLARFYSCIMLNVLSGVFILYRNIVFLIFEEGQIIIYVHVSYSLSMMALWLNRQSLCFLSLMQCDLLDLLLDRLCIITCLCDILHCSIFEDISKCHNVLTS